MSFTAEPFMKIVFPFLTKTSRADYGNRPIKDNLIILLHKSHFRQHLDIGWCTIDLIILFSWKDP